MKRAGKCSKCGWICCENCEHLTDEGLCKIYKRRPKGCRIYPHNPMALEKGCTIYFIENGEKITADNFQSFSEEIKQAWLDMVIF